MYCCHGFWVQFWGSGLTMRSETQRHLIWWLWNVKNKSWKSDCAFNYVCVIWKNKKQMQRLNTWRNSSPTDQLLVVIGSTGSVEGLCRTGGLWRRCQETRCLQEQRFVTSSIKEKTTEELQSIQSVAGCRDLARTVSYTAPRWSRTISPTLVSTNKRARLRQSYQRQLRSADRHRTKHHFFLHSHLF